MENIEFDNFENGERNDSERMYEMGKNYYRNNSEVLAEKYLKEAAKGGNRKAFLILADIYLKHNKLKFKIKETLEKIKNFLSKIKVVQEIKIL